MNKLRYKLNKNINQKQKEIINNLKLRFIHLHNSICI
jgi:hypothetical protein